VEIQEYEEDEENEGNTMVLRTKSRKQNSRRKKGYVV